MKFITSPLYEVDIGDHPFRMNKFRMIKEAVLREGIATPDDFIEPEPASVEDVALVHDAAYVRGVRDGTLPLEIELRIELPYSKALAQASFVGAGGTIRACREALGFPAAGRSPAGNAQRAGKSSGEKKWNVAYHIGGGFHHAYPDHGEGFCVFNDIGIGIRNMQQEGLIKKAMVIDCDVHQGNGTAVIFQNDTEVFTFSIHQEDNYPMPKEKSDLDIPLWGGDGDEPFLNALRAHVPQILNDHKPELLIYVAGADPYVGDLLGQLNITMRGLEERDRIVLGAAARLKIPTAIVLAGGYAEDPQDLIDIHVQTARVARDPASRV